MARKPIELVESTEDKRPRNPRANALPTEGYVVEIDGKMKAEYTTPEAAFKAGSEIKKNFPSVQVRIYDAKERTRTQIEVPKAEAASES
jgi:hypothetical protein